MYNTCTTTTYRVEQCTTPVQQQHTGSSNVHYGCIANSFNSNTEQINSQFHNQIRHTYVTNFKNIHTQKVKERIAFNGCSHLSALDITCHMGSQCYLPPDTSESFYRSRVRHPNHYTTEPPTNLLSSYLHHIE